MVEQEITFAALWFLRVSIIYFLYANFVYLVLLIISTFIIRRKQRTDPLLMSLIRKANLFAPPISIIAPAYNEEKTIVESIKSFLTLDYPEHELIVVNDGSKDRTMDVLQKEFELYPREIERDRGLSNTKIRGVYGARFHPNLFVIDKENGGKADSLNMGMEFSQHNHVCCVDSDSLLESEALVRVVIPFVEDPNTVASGGVVRVANGGTVRGGRIEGLKLPWNPIVLFQIVEYLRSFLCGRVGWNALNSTLIISGAFGLFRKDAVKLVGGYRTDSLGEDMELIVQLHEYYRKHKEPYRVVFLAEPVCWTEVPDRYRVLYRQRSRWQRGLADVLRRHRHMIFNPRFGAVGWIALPYFLTVELFGAVIEVVAYFCLAILMFTGKGDFSTLVLFWVVGIAYSVFMSVGTLILEERFFSKYPRLRSLTVLLIFGFLESFGWRQLMSLIRLLGLYSYIRGNREWGKMDRRGFGGVTPAA